MTAGRPLPTLLVIPTGIGCALGGYAGDALPAAHAHGLQAVAHLATLHLVQQRGHDARAGRAHRMAQRDARAVDVQALGVVPVPALEHRQRLEPLERQLRLVLL